MIGSTEWIVIGVVVLVLFGGAAIPKFARSLGKAKKEFEQGLKEGAAEAESPDDAAPKPGKKK